MTPPMRLSDIMHLALADLEEVASELAAKPGQRWATERIRAAVALMEAVRINVEHDGGAVQPMPPAKAHRAPVVDLSAVRAARAAAIAEIGGTG